MGLSFRSAFFVPPRRRSAATAAVAIAMTAAVVAVRMFVCFCVGRVPGRGCKLSVCLAERRSLFLPFVLRPRWLCAQGAVLSFSFPLPGPRPGHSPGSVLFGVFRLALVGVLGLLSVGLGLCLCGCSLCLLLCLLVLVFLCHGVLFSCL